MRYKIVLGIKGKWVVLETFPLSLMIHDSWLRHLLPSQVIETWTLDRHCHHFTSMCTTSYTCTKVQAEVKKHSTKHTPSFLTTHQHPSAYLYRSVSIPHTEQTGLKTPTRLRALTVASGIIRTTFTGRGLGDNEWWICVGSADLSESGDGVWFVIAGLLRFAVLGRVFLFEDPVSSGWICRWYKYKDRLKHNWAIPYILLEQQE